MTNNCLDRAGGERRGRSGRRRRRGTVWPTASTEALWEGRRRRGRQAEPAQGWGLSVISVGSGLWAGLWLSGTWADLGSGEGCFAAMGSGALCFFWGLGESKTRVCARLSPPWRAVTCSGHSLLLWGSPSEWLSPWLPLAMPYLMFPGLLHHFL